MRGKERETLGRWLVAAENRRHLVRRTAHNYPIPIQDAPSVHVEILVANPELRILVDPRSKPPDGLGLALRRPSHKPGGTSGWRGSGLNTAQFGSGILDAENRASDSLVHLYFRRRDDEAPSIQRIASYLHVYMPLRFTTRALMGHWLIVLALALGALFVGSQMLYAAWTGIKPDLLSSAITITALVVMVALWLVTVHPSNELAG